MVERVEAEADAFEAGGAKFANVVKTTIFLTDMADFAAVKDQLSATPGSFWTDGTTLYVHPFASTDPRTDGKRYERSCDFAGAAVVAHRLFEVVRTRVDIWLDPWSVYEGRGYQPAQAMFSFANGGTAGTGLGMGSPNKIPAASTDYIFAAVGEELGMIGATAVLIAFLLIIGAGLRIAVRADRDVEKLLLGTCAELGVAFVPFALFIGVSMSITAFPVLARILRGERIQHPATLPTFSRPANTSIVA